MSGSASPRTAGWLWLVIGAAAAAFGLLAGLSLGGAAYAPAAAGLPDAGPVVGWGLPAAKALTVIAGTLTLGFLTSAAFLIPSAGEGLVSRSGRSDLVRAGYSAAVWSVAAFATLLFTHATAVGMQPREALDPAVFFTFAFEIPQNRAYLLSGILAAILAAGAAFTARTSAAALWLGLGTIALIGPPLSAHGTSLGDHSLALTAGVAHALAAALWIGGLVAMTVHAWRGDRGLPVAIGRFSTLATVCIGVLIVSGLANAYTRLEQPGDLFASGYGVLVLVKITLLASLAAVAIRTRRSVSSGDTGLLPWLLTEMFLLAVTVGVAVSMTLTAYPRSDVPLPSPAEELLGFPFPPSPTAATLVLGWYPDVFFLTLSALLLGGYLWGVGTLRRRGIPWPWGRTIAWVGGVAFLVWATSAGIAGYAFVSVQWHMVQHMVMAMVVPILLVLGMPTTLALRAFRPSRSRDRGPREWVLWALNTPYSRLVTHPLVILALGTFGLFGLYLTPLFGLGMGSHLGHILMGIHFLVSGFLFYWVVMGLDPGPRQVPAMARLILLLIAISLHAFFAVAMMSMTQPLAQEWYGLVQPPWITDAVRDTIDGGGVAWGFGEIPTVIVMVVVAVQWARSEDRTARRLDRQADRDGDAELNAYNERLARLAARSGSRSGE